jgi:3-oxoacyl-[acyl-carrier protein] reductase
VTFSDCEISLAHSARRDGGRQDRICFPRAGRGILRDVEALAAGALSAFGRVDILINNAAIRPHKPFTETTQADWELIRSVVLDGPLYLTQALIEPMVENRYGRILFFCDDGSISASGTGRTHLSAAKMGLIGMARGLASEFASHNIRVNVVSPGSIVACGAPTDADDRHADL